MSGLDTYHRKIPWKTLKVGKNKFQYRYYKNPQSSVTLMLLMGGVGLSDMFYLHFARYAKTFSVITFDYQTPFTSQKEFADMVAKLLEFLDVKVWMIGHSLGGITAQIIAKYHPERVEGMVLSDTIPLIKDVGQGAEICLKDMLDELEKGKNMFHRAPFTFYKKMAKSVIIKKAKDFSPKEKEVTKNISNVIMK